MKKYLEKKFKTKTKGVITGQQLVKMLIEKDNEKAHENIVLFMKCTQEQAKELIDIVNTQEETQESNDITLPTETVNSLSTLGSRFKSIFSSLVSSSNDAKEKAKKYKDFVIEDNEQDKEIAQIIKELQDVYKVQTKERKDVTTQLDSLKKPLISLEKEIEEAGKFLKSKRDDYAQRVHEEAKKLEAEKALKAAKEQEIVKVKHFIAQNVESNLLNLIQEARTFFDNAFINLTIENYEATKKAMNFKPKLKAEKYEQLFNFCKVQYLNKEECETILKAAKEKFDYDSFNNRYIQEIEDLKTDFEEKAAKRITQLKSGKKENEEIEKENEAIAQAQKEAIEKERKELEKMFQENLTKEALENELNSQMEIEEIKETPKGTSVSYECEVSNKEAYVSLVAHYIAMGGNESKLKFLRDFAAKNGKPEIDGVKYNEVIKSSLKGL